MNDLNEPPLPATVGDYRIVRRIGSGGFGSVYEAVNANGSVVALKVLRPELSDDQLLRQRLQREGEAIQAVQGHRTVKVHDVVTDGPSAYLVMELLNGPNLEIFVRDQGPMTGPLLWYVTEGLVQALSDIHSAGIIHRDLKPSNVIFGQDGIKVLDFGISSIADTTSLTNTGAFIGTAAWISPEQINTGETTFSSDVFNLGLLIAFLSTGKHPYGSGRSDAVMYRISHSSPDLSGIPSPINQLIERCLKRDPYSRPSVPELLTFLSSSGQTWGASTIEKAELPSNPSSKEGSTPSPICQDGGPERTVVLPQRQALIESGVIPTGPIAEAPLSSQTPTFPKIAVGIGLALLLGVASIILFVSGNTDSPSPSLEPLTTAVPNTLERQPTEIETTAAPPSSIISYPPITYRSIVVQDIFPGPFPTETDPGACNQDLFVKTFQTYEGVPVSCVGVWALTYFSDQYAWVFRWTVDGWDERGEIDTLCLSTIDGTGMPRNVANEYWNVDFLKTLDYPDCNEPISTRPEDPTGPLQIGAIGERVRQLQLRLIEWKLLYDSADGRFGPNTRNAVYDYQHLAGLTPTGIVDERTAQALDLPWP